MLPSLETREQETMVRRKRRAMILSDQEVLQIRKRAKEGHSVRQIAATFGIGHAQIHRIVTGQSRRDVK